MRRPAQTRAQKQHAREQRALLRLRRAAVRYSIASEPTSGVVDNLPLAFADLTAACDVYRLTINAREARRLSR
jgi:hypothetical protein